VHQGGGNMTGIIGRVKYDDQMIVDGIVPDDE
jgi:hypothetical protein